MFHLIELRARYLLRLKYSVFEWFHVRVSGKGLTSRFARFEHLWGEACSGLRGYLPILHMRKCRFEVTTRLISTLYALLITYYFIYFVNAFNYSWVIHELKCHEIATTQLSKVNIIRLIEYSVASNGNEAATLAQTNELSIFTGFFRRLPPWIIPFI